MRNATRRSRKIGLTQGGRVKHGHAREKRSRLFPQSTWEKLSVESDSLLVVRENPSRAYIHPASPAEIRETLGRLSTDLTEDIRAVILRRVPKVDEKNLVEARKQHSCVILNAFPRDLRMVWRTKPTRAALSHMGPWCNRWLEDAGVWVLQWTADEIRRYYLYHLLLHEVGHFNGWFSSRRRREDFAENFALEWARRLGEIPSQAEAGT